MTPLSQDHPSGAVVMHMDVTERRAAAERIVYLNRVYATLSGINTLIVRVADRATLFGEACRISVEAGGFRMALIAIADQTTGKVALAASAGVDDALYIALKSYFISVDSPELRSTLLQRVVTHKKAVVVNDLEGNVEVVFRKQYVDSGVNSLAILPLIVAGNAVGTLVLYASERDFFRDEEMTLLTELAGDVSFAIDHIDKQERIDYLAYYDVLTGLANQRLFLERLAQYVRSAGTGAHQLAVYLMDIERFKNINDSLGQPAGDELLRQATRG
ncbi:MAG: GAF domain-containing protein [Burkholderiales bacterium]|nr:GAF domain-containing protein [Burkholderiales bacterium]